MIGVVVFVLSFVFGYVIVMFDVVCEGLIDSGVGYVQVLYYGYFDLIGEWLLQYGLSVDEQVVVMQVIVKLFGVVMIVCGIDFDGFVLNGDFSYGFVGEGIELNCELFGFFDYYMVLLGCYLLLMNVGIEVVVGVEFVCKFGVYVGLVVQLMVLIVYGGINVIDVQIVGVMSIGNKDVDEWIVNVMFVVVQVLLCIDCVLCIVVFFKDIVGMLVVVVMLCVVLLMFDVWIWDQLVLFYYQVVVLYKNQFLVFGVIFCVMILLLMSNWILMSIVECCCEIVMLCVFGVLVVMVCSVLIQEIVLFGLFGVVVGIVFVLLMMVVFNYVQIYLFVLFGCVKLILFEFIVLFVVVVVVEVVFVVFGVVVVLFVMFGFVKCNIFEGFVL